MPTTLTRRNWLAAAIAGYASPSWALAAAGTRAAAAPPATPQEAVTDRYFGVDVVDRYRWMEVQPRSERWNGWLKAQAGYARAALDALPGRAALARRLDTFSADTDTLYTVAPAGGKLFTLLRPAGGDTPQLFVRDGVAGSARLLFDPAAGRAAGAATRVLDWFSPSPTGRHVAIGVSEGGSEISAGYILDVASGQLRELTTIFCRASGWSADGTGFYYFRLRADAVRGSVDFGKGGSCWLHRLGSAPGSDQEVLRAGEGPDVEPLEDDMPMVEGAPGSDWVLGRHAVNGHFAALLYVARADALLAGRPAWRKLGGRAAGMLQAVLHGDDVYVLANGRAGNGEVVKIDARSGDFASGSVVVAAGEGVISGVGVARDGLYVQAIAAGLGSLRRLDWQGRLAPVALAREGAVFDVATAPDADGALFQMDALTWPAASFLVDAATLKASEIALTRPPAYSTAAFTTTRVDARARDGAAVGLEILHRKGLPLNRRNPTLIIAYGAYGNILDPGFQPRTLAFLDAGGVIVYAHVRGGGERGEAWHLAGMKATKPNTWRDALDAADYMIKAGWTARGRLAIWGTSAGGVMVGRAITERPELFGAAIGEVGMFNPLRFELTSNGPGNDAEFGTVKKEDEFHALHAMDAYHAVRDGVRYPAVLLITGANDMRVEPWQVGKFAARLQTASTNPAGALLRVDYDAGHYSATRKKAKALSLDVYSFILAHTRGA